MTVRVALRSLVARPVRSAVLACGFGFGIGVMAGLLGIGEVILEQARSPALEGGGDVVVAGASGGVTSARFVMSSVLGAPPLSERVIAASPVRSARLYLVEGDRITAVDARGGIPSLEKALGDPEVSGLDVWSDAPSDAPWSAPDPASVLRAMDRFHPIPVLPEEAGPWVGSWAEWLYFNGSAGDVKLYLSLIVGPEDEPGTRRARVRLQLDRGGRRADYSATATLPAAEILAGAPDIQVGDTRVRLDGLVYRIALSLFRETGPPGARAPDLTGEITLEATPGRSLPPLAMFGARGWVSGYVVPVLSGALSGTLRVEGETVQLAGGTGYHDHNWGFWEGVTWQWGQVAGDGLSVVYGRIRPPADVADPERVPGFMMVLGPEGPVGFSADVTIEEDNDPVRGHPRRIAVTAAGREIDIRMTIAIDDAAVRTRIGEGRGAVDFLQMRGTYRVTGRVGDRDVDFSAAGAAETFRGGPETVAPAAPGAAW